MVKYSSEVKYTSTGCEIVYQEIGKPSENYRIEIEKKNGKLLTTKIFEKEG